jgi:NADH-quinone oxidoreductase subunit F
VDLHVVGPLASPAERAAVDAILGPAESGSRGGRRNSLTEGHVASGGHEARSRRDLLLPALHALQDRVGLITQPGLNYVCRRLSVPPAEAYGVATFYALLSTKPRPPAVAHVCDDIACRLAGAEELCGDMERVLGPAGAAARDGRIGWLRSPCLGLCELAPAAMFTIAGRARREVAPIDAAGSWRAGTGRGLGDGAPVSTARRHFAPRPASAPQIGSRSSASRRGVADPSLGLRPAAVRMRQALAIGGM